MSKCRRMGGDSLDWQIQSTTPCNSLKAAAAAVNQTPLDWPGNARRIRDAIAAARRAKVSLLCLPELCITGYGCEDAFYSTGVQRTASAVLQELLTATRGMIVSLGVPLLYGGGLFNMAALAVDGRLVGMVGKQKPGGGRRALRTALVQALARGSASGIRLRGREDSSRRLDVQRRRVRIRFRDL